MIAQVHHTIPYGFGLLAIGLLIRHRIGRRRFNRRNLAGLQQFPSYVQALVTITSERLGMLIANLCIAAGGILLAVAGITHPKF